MKQIANPPIQPMTGEPWEPHVFKKGDRVKHRRRTECCCPVCGGIAHTEAMGGLTGTVAEVAGIGVRYQTDGLLCGHTFSESGHRFGVRWDDTGEVAFSAAVELEPLEGE